MKFLLVVLLSVFTISSHSQNLGKARIDKLKSSICRILIDNQVNGTGFFVSNKLIATCFHVIRPAIIVDPITMGVTIRKIEAEFYNGDKVEIQLLDSFTIDIDWAVNGQCFDFCILQTKSIPKTKISLFKLGKYQDIAEGDKIYSCGYPLGIKQLFISSGILSTKWIDKVPYKNNIIQWDTIFLRNVSWIDMTSNKGCSGSPIIKWGSTENDDKIIGISTFILNPFAHYTDSLNDYIKKLPPKFGAAIAGMFTSDVYKLFASAISSNSIGVSGCVSIDYLNYYLKKVNH